MTIFTITDELPLRVAAATQLRVIGALVLREMHTRFGRDNIGYLWMFIEPSILAVAVVGIHAGAGTRFGHGMQVASFALSGYVPFLLFRGIVLRAGPTIEANRSLLVHRFITLLDLLVARAVLEFLTISATFLMLLSLFAAFGLANLPDRPLTSLTGMVLLWWISFGMSMVFCAAVQWAEIIFRKINALHPTQGK